jgi:hypothetical protein
MPSQQRRTLKYCHLSSKIAICTPREALCVDLIGPYILKGKGSSAIDFMALTMIDPASSWFEIVELPLVKRLTTMKVISKEKVSKELIFDKSYNQIARLINKIWLSRYPRCQYLIYGNGWEIKLHFETLCESHGIKRKPTTIKNPQANAICERIHQVLGTMMRFSEIDMAQSVEPADIDTFIDNAAWAIRSTYHTVLKASPGALIFGHDMLFDVPFIADWKQIGEFRQSITDCNSDNKNKKRVDYDYKVGNKILIRKDGILRKAESI